MASNKKKKGAAAKGKAHAEPGVGLSDFVPFIALALLGAALAVLGTRLLTTGAGAQLGELYDELPAEYYGDTHSVVDALVPTTDVQGQFKVARVVSTHDFTDRVLNQPEDRIVVVLFLDPRSEAFATLRETIDGIALALEEHEELGGKASLAVVNSGLDTYLSYSYADLRTSWDGNTEVESMSFLFGRETLYWVLTRVFKGGKVVDAFSGVYTPKTMVQLAQLNLRRGAVSTVTTAAEMEALGAQNRPLLVACTEGAAATKWRGGSPRAFLAQASGAALAEGTLCASPDGPCALAAVDRAGSSHCLPVAKANSDPEAESVAEAEFIREHTRVQLEPLAASVVPAYMRKYALVGVVVLAPAEGMLFAAVQDVLDRVLRHPRLGHLAGHIDFLWSNSGHTGWAGKGLGEAPALALFESRCLENATMLDHFGQRIGTGRDADSEADTIVDWLLDIVPKGDLPAVLEAHALFVAELSASQGQPAPVHEHRKAPDLPAGTADSFAQQSTAELYATYEIRDLLKLFALAMEHFFILEEIVEVLGAQAQSREPEMVGVVEMVRNYVTQHPFLHPLFKVMPRSPALLKERLKDGKDKRERLAFLRAIERLDVQRTSIINAVHQEGPNSQTVQEWAEAVHFLEYAIYSVHNARGDDWLHSGEARPWPEVVQIDRIAASELSLADFLRDYAVPGRPVIITGAETFRRELTFEHLKEKCGDVRADPVKLDTRKMTWGGLVSVSTNITIAEFLDTFQDDPERRDWYIHDMSLPRKCPNIFGPPPYEEFVFPKYFASDYFQRVPFNGYQHTWPSLFVGAKGTQSKMHIDSGGTNFWMHLVSGKKEWRFFERTDIPNLYLQPFSSHFHVDVFNPDLERFPLFTKARMFQGIQEAGDLIYIPAGAPHGVRNLDDIVAISMNYVDESNRWQYLHTQLMLHRFREVEEMLHANFPVGIRSDQGDMTLGEFKSTDWFKLWQEGKLDLDL